MRRILMLLAIVAFAAAGGAPAEEVTLEHRGLTLNANLETVDGAEAMAAFAGS